MSVVCNWPYTALEKWTPSRHNNNSRSGDLPLHPYTVSMPLQRYYYHLLNKLFITYTTPHYCHITSKWILMKAILLVAKLVWLMNIMSPRAITCHLKCHFCCFTGECNNRFLWFLWSVCTKMKYNVSLFLTHGIMYCNVAFCSVIILLSHHYAQSSCIAM